MATPGLELQPMMRRTGRCPVCGDALDRGPMADCGLCQAATHAECRSFAPGCPTYGCRGTLVVRGLSEPVGRTRRIQPVSTGTEARTHRSQARVPRLVPRSVGGAGSDQVSQGNAPLPEPAPPAEIAWLLLAIVVGGLLDSWLPSGALRGAAWMVGLAVYGSVLVRLAGGLADGFVRMFYGV